jgi:hypothetical protein
MRSAAAVRGVEDGRRDSRKETMMDSIPNVRGPFHSIQFGEGWSVGRW